MECRRLGEAIPCQDVAPEIAVVPRRVVACGIRPCSTSSVRSTSSVASRTQHVGRYVSLNGASQRDTSLPLTSRSRQHAATTPPTQVAAAATIKCVTPTAMMLRHARDLLRGTTESRRPAELELAIAPT
jgi:hypothetical protein